MRIIFLSVFVLLTYIVQAQTTEKKVTKSLDAQIPEVLQNRLNNRIPTFHDSRRF
jgi:hypothetical protein